MEEKINIDFNEQISNFGKYIDEVEKDFKKEKEEKKEQIFKFKELFSTKNIFSNLFSVKDDNLLEFIDIQMKNFVKTFEYLENEIIRNKELLLFSMKWNYILSELLKGSEVGKLEREIKELDKETKLMRRKGIQFVLQDLADRFSMLENNENTNGENSD